MLNVTLGDVMEVVGVDVTDMFVEPGSTGAVKSAPWIVSVPVFNVTL